MRGWLSCAEGLHTHHSVDVDQLERRALCAGPARKSGIAAAES